MNPIRYYSCFALIYTFLDYRKIVSLKSLCRQLQNLLDNDLLSNELTLTLNKYLPYINCLWNKLKLNSSFKRLILNYCSIQDTFFQTLDRITQLSIMNASKLQLNSCEIYDTYNTNESIQFSKMQSIEMYKCRLSRLPPVFFNQFPNVEKVKLRFGLINENFTDGRFNRLLEKMWIISPNIKELILINISINNLGIILIAKMNKLKVLKLIMESTPEDDLDDSILLLSKNCVDLEVLELSNLDRLHNGLIGIGDNCKKITSLTLHIKYNYNLYHERSSSDDIGDLIPKLPLLTELNLDIHKFNDNSIDNLGCNLRIFKHKISGYGYCTISSKSLTNFILRSKRLRVLHIYDCKFVTAKVVKALPYCVYLKEVGFPRYMSGNDEKCPEKKSVLFKHPCNNSPIKPLLKNCSKLEIIYAQNKKGKPEVIWMRK